jgi:NTE family protein
MNGELRVAGQIGDDPALSVDIYQPLDPGLRWYVGGALGLGSFNSSLFAFDTELAEFRVRQRTASIFGGRNLGDWGSLRLTLRRDVGDTELRVGDPAIFSDYEFDLGRVEASFVADNLDDLNFPRVGQLLAFEWSGSREGLGSDSNFDQISGQVGLPITWGRNTVVAGAIYETTLDDDAPFEALYRAGGFLRLSGFQTDQLAGQHFGLVGASYYRKVNDFSFLPVYLGASLEAGNVWQRKSDVFDDVILAGSAFVGLDTPIGPMFLAYGVAEGGHDSFYLTLGKPVLVQRR